MGQNSIMLWEFQILTTDKGISKMYFFIAKNSIFVLWATKVLFFFHTTKLSDCVMTNKSKKTGSLTFLPEQKCPTSGRHKRHGSQ